MKVEFLVDRPELLDEVAELWLENLGKHWLPTLTKENAIEKFSSHLNKDTLPLTLLLTDNQSLIGTVSLRKNDTINNDFTPWLASLVVHPNYQKQGIGRLLVEKIQQEAKRLGYSDLYLFTGDTSLSKWYEKLGWVIIGHEKVFDRDAIIMKSKL
ncbi:MAG: GNAT family N-acetyltransferase [Gammaproteobacteria bacterium]|nr:GNAT family N-acetyltransferase [Gammaproteobacteria bacterium]